MAGTEAGSIDWSTVGGGLGGVLIALGIVYNFFKGKNEERKEPSHLVLEQASLADARPFLAKLDQVISVQERILLATEKSNTGGARFLESQESLLREFKEVREVLDQFIIDDRRRREESLKDEVNAFRIEKAMKAIRERDEADKRSRDS